jgi:thioredoxin-related protein
MNMYIKRLFTLLLGLGLLASMVAMAAAPRDPEKYFFDKSLGDYRDDLADAKEQGKIGIMFFFEQEECPFCHRMKTTILNQPVVQKYFKKHFLIFAMDIESSEEITDFGGNTTSMKKWFYKITRNRGATPVIAFFDLKGKLVVRYTGAASGTDEFLWLGQYMSEKQYQKMTFTRYKRMKRRAKRLAE